MAIPQQETKAGPASPTGDGSGVGSGTEGTLLTVDEIMLRVQRDVVSRGGQLPAAARPTAAAAMTFRLANWQPSAPRIAVKQEYALDELLSFSDSDFIDNAYRAILRRTPDQQGMSHHLSRLRNGQESKVGILAALRWSPEGEKAGVHVDGLLAPFLLQKWRRKRFIGPIIGWLHTLARLSSLSDRQVLLDAAYARENHELGRVLNLQAQQLERSLSEIESARAQQAATASAAFESIASRLEDAFARLAPLDSMDAHSRMLAERIDGLQAQLDEAMPEVRAHSLALEERIGELSLRLNEVEHVRAHSMAVADQVGTLSARLDGLAGVSDHSHAVAAQVGELSTRLDSLADVRGHAQSIAAQVGELSLRLNEVADVRAHSHAVAGHVGTLSTRLDELSDVRAHSHEVAGQVGTLSARLDELSVLSEQAKALAYRVDTLTARLDGQPDVVPVVRLMSERIEEISAQLPAPADKADAHGRKAGTLRGQ